MARNVKDLINKPLSKASFSELSNLIKTAKSELGLGISDSGFLGKAERLRKVLRPDKFTAKDVSSAKTALVPSTTLETQERLGFAPPKASTADLTGFLDTFQNQNFALENALPGEDISAIQDFLLPDQGLPELYSGADRFLELRDEFDVGGLEQNLGELEADIEEEYALLRTQRVQERGKPVAQNVIEGRIGIEERTAQERIDFLTRQRNSIVNQLNTAYQIVGQIMQFEATDYTNAVARYKTQFDQNLAIYNVISTAQNRTQDIARSNLQIIIGNITSGNLSYADLPDDQKLLIQKLEIQSGLPSGFTEGLKMSQKDRILFTSTSKGVTTVGIVGENGEITTQTYGTPTGDGDRSQFEVIRDESNEAREALVAVAGDDGRVSPHSYKTIRQRWVNETGSTYEDFDNRFSNFAEGAQSPIEDYDLKNDQSGTTVIG